MQGLERIEVMFAAVVLTAATTAAAAQDDAGTVAKTRSVIRLGAAEALESWVAGASFNRAEIARLVEIITSDPVAHQSSDPELVRAALRRDFLRRFDAQVADVAKIDKDEKYGLADWLAKNFARVPGPDGSPSPFDRAVASHESYLKGQELAQLYTAARKRVADSQFALVRKALGTDQSFPKEEDIEQIYSGIRDRAGLIADLKRSLGAGQRLLLEAEALVSALAAEMVSDGLNQLTAQLHALDDEPTAHTPQGIRRELASRQADVVHALKPAPTRKVYPVFPLAAKTAEQRALDRWDVRVAEAIGAVVAQFQRGDRRLPADLEAKLEAAIRANPSAHDTPTASERAFGPLTREIVLASRAWVRDVLQDVATRAPSKFDQPGELAGLLAALVPRLETGAAPRERWNTLSFDVRRAVERTIETVRERLAKVQAARECPDLMKGAWIPDEKLLVSHDPSLLVRRDLATLPIWRAGKPPEESAVLRETWDLWLEAAHNALELGHVAINSQRRLIDEQEPEILGLIKNDPSPGSSHWIDACAATVKRQWSSARSPASSRYPRLFKVTETEIEGIVVSALDLVVKDAQAALVQHLFPPVEQEIVNLAKAGKAPVFEPHYQAFRATVEREWTKHKLAPLHADLFSATDDAIRSRVQKSVDAQVARLKQIENGLGPLVGQFNSASSGSQDPEEQQQRWTHDLAAVLGGYQIPERMRDHVERIDKRVRAQVALENLVFEHQSKHVTENEAAIGKRVRAGEFPTQITVAGEPVRNTDGPPDSKNREPKGVVIPSLSGRDEGPLGGLKPPSESLSSRISPFWLLLLVPMVGLALWLWRRRGNHEKSSGKGSADWRVLAKRYLPLYHSFVQLYLEESEGILIGYIQKKGPPVTTDSE